MDIVIPDAAYHTIDQKERYRIALSNAWQGFRYGWSIYARNRLALFGLFLLVVFFLLAALHPILMKTTWEKRIYDPVTGHDVMVFPHPSPPSASHLLGTDALGRDVLSILMAATGPSIIMALTAALSAAIIGILIAAFSAYHRGLVDFAFTNLADLSLLAPAPILMVVIGFLFDISPFKFGLIYGLLAGIGAVGVVLRAHAVTITNKTFIAAAMVAGGGPLHIITRHLIPHLIPLAAVNMLLTVTGAVFANGFIAFLGLSRAQLNWGSMIYDSFTYQQLSTTIPWNVLIPSAMAISLFAASFYLISLGLHDVVDPRSAERLAPQPVIETKVEHLPPVMVVQEPEVALALAPEQAAPLPLSMAPVDEPPAAQAMAEIGLVERALTVLVFGFRPLGSNELPLPAGLKGYLESDALQLLAQQGAKISQINSKAYLVVYGLDSHLPDRVSALLAAQASLDLMQKARAQSEADWKICVGISSGWAQLDGYSNENWKELVFATTLGQTARALCGYAGYMKHGGILIGQETFDDLEAVQHHFKFGRQGLAKLPPENQQGMIFELLAE